MAGSTNFLQHNPTAANQENDTAYASDSIRTGGIGVDEILPSVWLNKVWFQSSTFIAAMAYVMANFGAGFTITDTSLATLKTNIANFFNALVSAGFTSGNNSNGYWEQIPTGRIEQWNPVGISFPSTSDIAVTFPINYTNAASIQIDTCGLNASGNDASGSIVAGSVTTAGFTLHCLYTVPAVITWRSTGY